MKTPTTDHLRRWGAVYIPLLSVGLGRGVPVGVAAFPRCLLAEHAEDRPPVFRARLLYRAVAEVHRSPLVGLG